MIYILEDDSSIRELVNYTLNNSGLESEGFSRPSQFWKKMNEALPDLVLLDIMLPEEDGLSILKKLRNNPETETLPVIMVTAKVTEYDKVIGLDGGADDYISKPFGMMELVSRVKALLRRTKKTETEKDEYYEIGGLYVNPSKHIVLADGENVTLTIKEFNLLCLMLKKPGVVFSRDQLLYEIWGYEYDGESRTVDVHIRTLRQKLGKCGNIIETVRGAGYRIGGDNS